VGGQLHIPAALRLGIELPVPIDYEAGLVPGADLEVLEKRKIFTFTRKGTIPLPPRVKPSHYTV
jgi:hypothetical protein